MPRRREKMSFVNRHLEQVNPTEEEQWEFAEALFGSGIREELDSEAEPEAEEEAEEAEEETTRELGVYQVRFYAENGKAIAKADFGGEEHKMQIKDREHAVRIARRAVAKANEDGAGIEFLHGFQADENDPFNPTIEQACLSQAAYTEIWAELEAAEFNSQPISW